MKRIIAIVLSIAVIFTLVCIPVLADSVDHVGEIHPNLLDNFSYFNWYNDNYDYDSQFPSVSYDGREAYYLRLNFVGNHSSFSVDRLYLNFTASQFLEFSDVVILYQSPTGAASVSADYVNHISTSDNLIYYSYLFDLGDVIQGEFTLEFSFLDASTYFQINLLDLYSNFGSNSVSIDNGQVKFTGTEQNQGEGFYDQPYFDGYVSFPYTFNDTYTSPVGPYDNYMEVYITIPGSEVQRADQFVLTFISTGVFDNYYDHTQLSNGGLYLKGAQDSFNVPINAYYSLMDSSWNGLDIWRVSVVADLSGYDLSGYNIVFSTMFNGRITAALNPSSYNYFFRIESCKFYLNSAFNVPWYRTFYNWIAGQLWELNANINSNFTGLESRLESWFGGDQTPPDLSDQQQGMNDVIDDMGGLADDFENSQNEMEQLMPSMPSWEDTGLGELPGQYGANINQILVIFHAIYENTIITQILTFTFLFALGGFILFGER